VSAAVPWTLELGIVNRLFNHWAAAAGQPHHSPGSAKANGREPKTSLGRVFNFKLGCFDDVWVLIYADACPHLWLKTRPRFSPVSFSLSMHSHLHLSSMLHFLLQLLDTHMKKLIILALSVIIMKKRRETMSMESLVSSSALFTFWLGSLPLSDVFFITYLAPCKTTFLFTSVGNVIKLFKAVSYNFS
jgi:hypothetical protein